MQIASATQRQELMSFGKCSLTWHLMLKALLPAVILFTLLVQLAHSAVMFRCTKQLDNVAMLIIQWLIWPIFKICGALAHLPRVLHLDLPRDQLLSPVRSHRQSLLSIHPTVSMLTTMTRSSFKFSSREHFPLRRKPKFAQLMVLSSAR